MADGLGVQATEKKTKRSQQPAYKSLLTIATKPSSSSVPHFTLFANLSAPALGDLLSKPSCMSPLFVAHCLRLFPCNWSARPSPSSLYSLSPHRSPVPSSESTPQDLKLTAPHTLYRRSEPACSRLFHVVSGYLMYTVRSWFVGPSVKSKDRAASSARNSPSFTLVRPR